MMLRKCFSRYVSRRKTIRCLSEAAEDELRHSKSSTSESVASGTLQQIHSEFAF